jgi:Zn-dependent protease
MAALQSLGISGREFEDLVIADLALTVAFTLVLSGGAMGLSSGGAALPQLVAISFVAVTLSFVLHEMMHKYVAQSFGAIAAFRRSDSGILITLVTSFAGFLVGLPGATIIYTNSFTKREEGVVSIAGPLTNFAVFAAFFALNIFAAHAGVFVRQLISTTMLVSLIIAFYNMLPIYPLDGSKVLRWNKPAYAVTLAALFALLVAFLGFGAVLYGLAIMLVVAFVISLFFRGMIRF